MLNHMPTAKKVLGSMRKSKSSQITQNIQVLRQIFSNDVAMRKWVIGNNLWLDTCKLRKYSKSQK